MARTPVIVFLGCDWLYHTFILWRKTDDGANGIGLFHNLQDNRF